jgi:hypothetical protein
LDPENNWKGVNISVELANFVCENVLEA